MDSLNPDLNDQPVKQRTRVKKLVLVVSLAGFVTLVFLAGLVYFAFGYIRSSILSAPLSLPYLAEEPVRNQIAFVGNDDNLWLVKPDGANARQLTTDGKGYRFPTWAPDSRRVAFIGLDEDNNTAVFISPTSSAEPAVVYGEPESPPFYLYWAPDSRSITFLTQEKSGLSMRQVSTSDPGMARILGKGAPFYWVWSPRSDKMLLHVGGSRSISKEAHISMLDNQQDAERVELNLAPGRFQAPIWSASGQHIYYIAADEAGDEAIYRTDPTNLKQKLVTSLNGFAFMVLSPTDKHLAYLQLQPGTRPPFGKAYLVDTEGKNKQLLIDNPVASIYWSPDGKKLALLSITRPNEGPTAAKGSGLAAPLPQQAQLRWWIYHLEKEELTPLISFDPTTAFLQTVPYFDQYHLSLTFWSPDSRYMVVTKRTNDKGEGTVWVVDTEGEQQAMQVGEGTLAVWSWK